MNGASFAVAVATLYIAWKGVSTWRHQVRTKISLERAVSFLDSAYVYPQSIMLMITLAGDFRKLNLHLVNSSSPAQERKVREDMLRDKEIRMQAMNDAHASLLADWARVQVWWGNRFLMEEVGQLLVLAKRPIEECDRCMRTEDDSILKKWWSDVYAVNDSMREGFGPEISWYLTKKHKRAGKAETR